MVGAGQHTVPSGLLRIEDCLDARGGIVLPPGTTLISLIERNIASVGDAVAYRYLDHSGSGEPHVVELTWAELGLRLRAVGARIQELAGRGDRVAVLAPQGLEYIVGFLGAMQAGFIAVPLSVPLPGSHDERVSAVITDTSPTVVLTTAAAFDIAAQNVDDGASMVAVIAVDTLDLDADRDVDDAVTVDGSWLNYRHLTP